MRKVPHCNLLLHFYVRQPWTLVVHFERENAVLVGCREGGSIRSSVLRNGVEGGWGREDGCKAEAVEGREHSEFELYVIASGKVEAGVVGAVPEGDCYRVGLDMLARNSKGGTKTYDVVLNAVDIWVQKSELCGV